MTGGKRRLDIRRRLDATALRWQARLDTPWVDRSAPWMLAGLLTVLLIAIGLAVQRQLDGGPAQAVWAQAAWNLADSGRATSSLGGGDVVAEQWAFASIPLLFLGRWVAPEVVMAVAQPICVGIAVVPIWRMARDVARLRLGSTVAISLAYSGAPILYVANVSGWSAVVPAVPALAWGTWFGQRRRWIAYGLCMALALTARADVGLVLVFLGILGVSSGDRTSGLITSGVGLAWVVAFLAIVSPEVPQAPMTTGEAVIARGVAPLAVLRDPLRLVTDLVIQPNVGALVVLVGPFLFLPLVVPRFALPALSPIVLGMVGEEAVRQAVGPTPVSTDLPTVLILAVVPMGLAAIVALSRIGTQSVSRIRVDHRIVAAMLIATVSIFVQVAPASPFNEPWSWGGRDAVDGARMQAIDALDEVYGDGPVSVSPQLMTLVADRPEVVELRAGPPELPFVPETAAVVFDTTATDVDDVPLWDGNARVSVLSSLLASSYDVAYRAEGIIVLVRRD